MASCGSGDGFVYVYDTTSLAIKWARDEGMRRRYRLPGHRSIVNDVDFHPIEPIICSVSSDHSVIMGEILPWRVCGKQKSDIHTHKLLQSQVIKNNVLRGKGRRKQGVGIIKSRD